LAHRMGQPDNTSAQGNPGASAGRKTGQHRGEDALQAPTDRLHGRDDHD